MEESFKKEIELRIAKFKNDGLQFIYDDRKSNHDQQIFQLAFAEFINRGTHNEVQEFIDQIPNIKHKFHLLQNNENGNLCSAVLGYIKDPDRKTLVMQALFDAGMDYSFLKRGNGKSFIYAHNSCASLTLDSNGNVSNVCLPYLKTILSSKNYDKFTEIVQDIHLGQLGLRNLTMPVRPDFINAGLEAALEYIRDHSDKRKEIFEPFYDNLMDPKSVLGKFCSDIERLVKENNIELNKLRLDVAEGRFISGNDIPLNARERNVIEYETLQKRIRIFKEEFEKFPSLKNITENTINGVIKDKKSIEELPIPNKLKRDLEKGYHDTIHPEKREAYNQDYSKSNKFAEFLRPQIRDNIKAEGAKNKTESKQDIEANTKGINKKGRNL